MWPPCCSATFFTGSRWGWKVGSGGRQGWAVLLRISSAYRNRWSSGEPGKGKQLNKFIYFLLQSEIFGTCDQWCKRSETHPPTLHFLADVNGEGANSAGVVLTGVTLMQVVWNVSRMHLDKTRKSNLFGGRFCEVDSEFPGKCAEQTVGLTMAAEVVEWRLLILWAVKPATPSWLGGAQHGITGLVCWCRPSTAQPPPPFQIWSHFSRTVRSKSCDGDAAMWSKVNGNEKPTKRRKLELNKHFCQLKEKKIVKRKKNTITN